jgi:hypothetical protein
MKAIGYSSVQEIIERVLDTFDTEDIDYSVLIRHAADGLALIGTYDQMVEGIEKVVIKNYRGALPCNIASVEQVRNCSHKVPVRLSSNTFHTANDNPNLHQNVSEKGFTYSINGDYIITNFKEGEVELAVTKFPVDDKGFPLIPNAVEYKMALENYLLERIGYKLYLKDRITRDKYEEMKTQKMFYMGVAESFGQTPSAEQMELIKNVMVRLLEVPLSRDKFHTDLSSMETRRVNPKLRRF